MDHKIVLFGNGINKEIEIGKANNISVGTHKNCQVWLKGDLFTQEFLINICVNEDTYTVKCSESIEKASDDKNEYNLGEKIAFKYIGETSELFYLELVADFEDMSSDYHLSINLANIELIKIGNSDDCDIRIDEPEWNEIQLALEKSDDCYEVSINTGRNYITHNGNALVEDSFVLGNHDFFSIGNIQFWYSDGKLYTAEDSRLYSRLSTDVIREQNNQLKYPEFIKNVRLQFKQPKEKIEVLQPSTKPQEPQGSIAEKIIPMIVMMIMMTIMRVMIRSNIVYALYFVVMMGMSSVMTVIGFIKAKKTYKEKIAKRNRIYNEYIEKKDAEIILKRNDERLIAEKMNVMPQQTVEQIENFDARLFEKLKEHEDFLDVPIGTGTIYSNNQIEFKDQEYVETEDPLMNIPKNIHDKYEKLNDMPIVLHLSKSNAVGFLGTRTKLYQIAKNILITLAGQQFYQDVRFYAMLKEEDIPYFSWIRWLQNFNEEKRRNILCDEGSKKVVLEAIYNELSSREGKSESEIRALPHYVVFAYRSEYMSGHPITNYVKDAAKLGFTFLFFEEYKELIHEACDELVCLDRETNTGFIQSTSDAVETIDFKYPHLEGNIVSAAALKLACVHVNEISLESTLTKNITLYQLLKVMNAYDLDLKQRWANSNVYESMAAPLGVDSSGQTIYLDIHEKAHGPHGLVAGTTGSGKSEILQSYVLSTCINFHPYEVGFVIIDFKGGGMANQFKDLPHLNGAITNIDGKQINRSLMSIKAELMKRQRLFAEYSVNRIDDYIELFKTGVAKIPLPHLILIVDEFAELKSDQPEFMKELISAARIGRSLGMHLILATQKPAGVVNDQIWSNSKFKLCLKVQDKSDSNEVLKSPLAAEIREPGRAYLQVGNNEIFQLFQSAYSGASANIDQLEQRTQYDINVVDFAGRRRPIYSQKPKKAKMGGETQLDAIVSYIEDYCHQNNISRLPDICLPPLSEIIEYPKMEEETIKGDITLPIGIYDNPAEQEQKELIINLTKNNCILVGSAQTGKTNLIQTIIRGLCEKYTANDVCIYIADFASMMLKNFEKLNQVGGVITSSEDTMLRQLFELLSSTIEERKRILSELGLTSFGAYREAGLSDLKQIVFVVENYSMFKAIYPEYEGVFGAICRDGVAVGICVIISNPLSAGFGLKLMSYFGEKISLYQNDSTQYALVLEHCKLYPDNTPGRGVIKRNNTILEFQSYLAFSAEKEVEKVGKIREFVEECNLKNKGIVASQIPTIPDVVTVEHIKTHYSFEESNYVLPLGIRYEDIQPEYLNLGKENFFGVTGQDKLGRAKFLKCMFTYLLANNQNKPVELYVIDDISRELEYLKDWDITKAYITNQAEAESTIKVVFEEAKARYNLLAKGGGESLEEKPMTLLVFNSSLTEDILSVGKTSMQMHELLATKLRGCKTAVLHTNIANVAVSFKASAFTRLIVENCKMIGFDSLKNLKIFNISSSKENKKMEEGDAYYISNGVVKKLRVTLQEK